MDSTLYLSYTRQGQVTLRKYINKWLAMNFLMSFTFKHSALKTLLFFLLTVLQLTVSISYQLVLQSRTKQGIMALGY